MTVSAVYPSLLLLSPTGGNTIMGPVFMYGAIFAIFYFVLIRPQQKQRKEHESLVQNLKKGDEVVTAGGVIGEVVHIKVAMKDGTPHPTMDDRVTIRSGESKMIIERGRITKVVPAGAAVDAGA
jgi:preprotein translocase subunit YajC